MGIEFDSRRQGPEMMRRRAKVGYECLVLGVDGSARARLEGWREGETWTNQRDRRGISDSWRKIICENSSEVSKGDFGEDMQRTGYRSVVPPFHS